MTVAEIAEAQKKLRDARSAEQESIQQQKKNKDEGIPNETLFNCLFCHKTFAKVGYAQTHIRYIHNTTSSTEEIKTITSLLASGQQPQNWPQASTLSSKFAPKSEASKRWECYDCHKPMQSIISLKKHLKMHTGVKFKCGVCDKIFGGRQYLRDHIIVVHEIAKEEVKKHIVHEYFSPAQVITHKCMDCKAKFTNEYKYQSHVCLQSTSGPLQCDMCNASYKSMYSLRRHRKTHNPVEDKQIHSCEHCNKSFPVRGYLLKHKQRMHSALLPGNFICDICGAQLNSQAHFTKHVHSHSVVKIKCNYCSKMLMEKSMKKHLLKKHSNKIVTDVE